VPLSRLATRGTAWESGNRQAPPNLRRLQRSRFPLLLPRRMGRPFCAGREAVLEAVLEVVLNLHQRVRTRLLRTRDEIRATILQSRIPQLRVKARRKRQTRRRMKMTNVPSYAGPTTLLGIVPPPRHLRPVRHQPRRKRTAIGRCFAAASLQTQRHKPGWRGRATRRFLGPQMRGQGRPHWRDPPRNYCLQSPTLPAQSRGLSNSFSSLGKRCKFKRRCRRLPNARSMPMRKCGSRAWLRPSFNRDHFMLSMQISAINRFSCTPLRLRWHLTLF